MRLFILDRDFAFQASALPTEEIRRAVNDCAQILECVIGHTMPRPLQLQLQTIPEVFMWIGHEALLYEFLAAHMDAYCDRVNTQGSPDQKHMAEYRRYQKIADALAAILFRTESKDYTLTLPADIPDDVIESHRCAFVAERPFERMRLFPRLADLSHPYIPAVIHSTDDADK